MEKEKEKSSKETKMQGKKSKNPMKTQVLKQHK
jgi:hypothetical protein